LESLAGLATTTIKTYIETKTESPSQLGINDAVSTVPLVPLKLDTPRATNIRVNRSN
jgi:hypothetical protein